MAELEFQGTKVTAESRVMQLLDSVERAVSISFIGKVGCCFNTCGATLARNCSESIGIILMHFLDQWILKWGKWTINNVEIPLFWNNISPRCKCKQTIQITPTTVSYHGLLQSNISVSPYLGAVLQFLMRKFMLNPSLSLLFISEWLDR